MSEHPDHPPAEPTADNRDESANAEINADCPCVDCGYNLRGLADDADCPECGAPVSRTLAMVESRALCPNCLAPTHPSQPNCAKCGAPLQASGAIAAFAGGQLHTPVSQKLGPAPLAPVILLWVMIGPMAVGGTMAWFALVYAIISHAWEAGLADSLSSISAVSVLLFLIMTAVVGVFDAVMVSVSLAYWRRKKAAAEQEEEADDESPAEPPEEEAPH